MLNCYDWLVPERYSGPRGFDSSVVNQGTAIKTKKVSELEHFYPEQRPRASQVWNVFNVKPREIGDHVTLKVLERHPYTTQTFVPVAGLAARLQYLVVVADDAMGSPDLRTIRAFACHGGQAGKS